MAQNMTRREALKRMGLIVGGAAVNLTALSALPSCVSEEKRGSYSISRQQVIVCMLLVSFLTIP